MSIWDDRDRYGQVSRILHWGMAALLLWQLVTVIARVLIKDTPIEEFTWGTHRPLGFLILVLVVVRIGWALGNMKHRPPSVSLAAKLGHIALYVLMVLIPTIALVRQYGSGRAFEPFGIAVFAGFESDEIEWMTELGSLLHGELGWLLFALIAGHIFMTYWHRRSPNHTDVLPRIWG